ncbi:SDR family NAD(P)-dependent oxidoreductase [Streptomyces sp. p1417]|uniref:SDR family NAD(P)-dependent oxidoreductase n=1 Tax=Streptomyces typhae TaxID=2681492 RepID=A0A6L6X6K6_9ACTN|nr:SDR family oxidoreductase [Streptomyces typhae]MVO89505.1 SDR family NAD(P)-dependent oxidoreductase [Streptomyces typhae]
MRTTRSPQALAEHSALVTGGSRGLGLLIADRLAARGCAVTLAARDTSELEDARDKLRRRHPGASLHTATCDVRDQEQVRAVLRTAHERSGGPDIVVANAGIIQVAPLDSIGADEFRSAMDTMFLGALHTALESLPYLRESTHGGRLALISSVGGLMGVPHLLPYACAKAATGVLAEGLHAETAADGVTVTAVYPGLMRTGSHLHAQFGGDRGKEYGWFSALAGAPLVSMNAQRAAERIADAVVRRRTRLVLTPAARAADLAHGVAPALTTRLNGLMARLLPEGTGTRESLREGKDIAPPQGAVTGRAQVLGSAMNERAADAYNQRST